MSERDMVNEIWAHRDDPEEWNEEAEDIQVKPSRSSVVSFRLPREELAEIERARAETGESLSGFIRNALALRLHGQTAARPVGIMYGSSGIAEIGSGTPIEISHEDSDRLRVNSNVFMVACTKASFTPKRSLFRESGSRQPLQQSLALRW